MCQIRQVQLHKFAEWYFGEVGHGHYCVSSYGLVYSHSDADVNFKIKSFTFGMGDVLHFEYHKRQRKLTVKNQISERY